jgi:hypothetical protein
MKYEVINLLHCLNIVRKTFMLFQNLKYYVTKNIKQVKPLLLLVLNQTLQKINAFLLTHKEVFSGSIKLMVIVVPNDD